MFNGHMQPIIYLVALIIGKKTKTMKQTSTLTSCCLKFFSLLTLFFVVTSVNAQSTTCDAHFAHYSLQNPDSVHFYPSTTGAESYFWTFGDNDSGSTELYPWHYFSSPGTYNICLTVIEPNSDACTWCDTIQIGATAPTCNATFSYYTIKNPDSLHFYPTSASGTAYYWNFGDGTYSDQRYPWHNYAHSGIYYVCLTVADSSGISCTKCDTVTVNPPPPCAASFNHYSLSNPDSLHFYSTGTGAISWNWNFGDGTTSDQQYPWHFYSQPGTYYVCLTIVDSAGGTCSACNNVYIGAPVTCSAAFSHYSLSAISDSLHFYPTGQGIKTTYWNFGDGTTSTNRDPWHYFTHAGTYSVCLTVVDSSGSTCNTCDTVSVSAAPCNATYTDYSIGSGSIRFHAGNVTANTYYWTWGDGTSSTVTVSNPAHTYASPGTYHACLTIGDTGGLSCTWCDTVVVPSATVSTCNAKFSHYNLSLNVDSLHFYPAATNVTSYSWNFGNGTTSTNEDPWYYFTSPGVHYVCLTVVTTADSTCSWCDTVQTGTVPPVCNASFSYYTIHNPDSLHFYPTGTAASSYYWSFGDGSTSTQQYPWHYYTGAGRYYVCLTVADTLGNSCTSCDTVAVAPNAATCNADFSHYFLTNSDSAHFYPAVTNASSYYWYFGDGTNSSNTDPWHYFAASGTYHVCLTAYTGGSSCTYCDTVVVAPVTSTCNSAFSYYIVHNPDSLHFYPTGSGATSWYWSFGDGTTSDQQYPWHFYTQPGSYYVCLTAAQASGITCTSCQTVKVGPTPICNATFVHYGLTADYPDSIHFYPTGGVSGDTYYWSFGDGATSSLFNPSHNYAHAGTYYACLTVVDTLGETCTSCDTVVAGHVPTCSAGFSHYSLTANSDSLHFYPLSTSGVGSYHWDFGDDSTSTQTDPWHYYAQSGTYYACLTVIDTNGLTCSNCDTVTIGKPGFEVSVHHYASRASGNDTVQFYVTGGSPSACYWDFGDGTYSIQFSPTHYYNVGTYYVVLTAADSTGAVSFAFDTVNSYATNVVTVLPTTADVKIFPNPANESATVQLTGLLDLATFRMYDITGRTVYSGVNLNNGEFTLDTRSIAPGLYFFTTTLTNNQVVAEGKLMVVH